MAILTGAALVSYIVMLARTGAAPGQVIRVTLRPAAASRPNPEYAAVPRPRPANRRSGPQRRLDYPSPAPEPRPAHAAAAAPPTRPSYPATGPQTDPQLRAAYQTGPQPRAARQTGPQPRAAARQTGPQPRAAYQTGPQPRATHPYPPAAPSPQQRRPQTTAGRDYPPWEGPARTTP